MQTRQVNLFGAIALLAIILSSGCVGGSSSATTPTATPTDFEPPAACSGNESSPDFDIPDGQLPARAGGFELTANESAVTRGEPIAFTLRNAGVERRHSGSRAKYVLQRRATDDWETVTLLRESHLGFNATAIVHEPTEGFEWSFEASAHGFTEGKYVVCQELPPGEYRFVYANDSPVAVSFELQ